MIGNGNAREACRPRPGNEFVDRTRAVREDRVIVQVPRPQRRAPRDRTWGRVARREVARRLLRRARGGLGGSIRRINSRLSGNALDGSIGFPANGLAGLGMLARLFSYDGTRVLLRLSVLLQLALQCLAPGLLAYAGIGIERCIRSFPHLPAGFRALASTLLCLFRRRFCTLCLRHGKPPLLSIVSCSCYTRSGGIDLVEQTACVLPCGTRDQARVFARTLGAIEDDRIETPTPGVCDSRCVSGEERARVIVCCPRDGCGIFARALGTVVGERIGGESDHRGLALHPSNGFGGHIRTICFEQDAIERTGGECLANALVAPERRSPAERYIAAETKKALRSGQIFSKAVEHAASLRNAVLLQHAGGICVRLARFVARIVSQMQFDGNPVLAGKRELRFHASNLNVMRSRFDVVIRVEVVVETNLAYPRAQRI